MTQDEPQEEMRWLLSKCSLHNTEYLSTKYFLKAGFISHSLIKQLLCYTSTGRCVEHLNLPSVDREEGGVELSHQIEIQFKSHSFICYLHILRAWLILYVRSVFECVSVLALECVCVCVSVGRWGGGWIGWQILITTSISFKSINVHVRTSVPLTPRLKSITLSIIT